MPAFYSCRHLGSERCRNLLIGTQLERSRTLESNFKVTWGNRMRRLGEGMMLGFSDPVGFPSLARKTGSGGTERRRKSPSGFGGRLLRALGTERKSQPGPAAPTPRQLMLKLSM